jgi:hypothetical protein
MPHAKTVQSNSAHNPVNARTKAGIVCFALLTGVFLLSLAQQSLADDSEVDTRTVNGHKVELIQAGQGDYRVRVDGKEVIKKQRPQAEMNMEGVYTGGGKSFVVVSRTVFNCGLRYQVIDLSDGAPVVSSEMGNCSGAPSISVAEGILKMTFPAKSGRSLMTSFPGQTATETVDASAARQASGQTGATVANAGNAWVFPDDWSAWVGKYPQDRVRGVELLQIPQVKEALGAITGPKERKEMDELRVSNPIEQHGSWIVAYGCMPHDCPGSNYTLAISEDARDVVLCLKADNDAATMSTLRWFRTGQSPLSRTLPIQTGAECSAEGVDPIRALLGRAAVDENGKPL